MKRRSIKLVALAMAASMVFAACGQKNEGETSETVVEETKSDSDVDAALEVGKLIDAIYVQERTDETDAQCEAAKAAWDALTDEQKQAVTGENADPDYFGRDTVCMKFGSGILLTSKSPVPKSS